MFKKIRTSIASVFKGQSEEKPLPSGHSMNMEAEISSALKSFEQGKIKEAEALCREILANQPAHAPALNLLGVIMLHSARRKEGFRLLSQALTADPDFAQAYNNLGMAFREDGVVDKAEANFLKAMELRSDFATARRNLGSLYFDQGRAEEAEVLYREAVAIRPDFADAYGDLGSSLILQGKLDEGLENCRKTLAMKPEHYVAHSNLLYYMNFNPAFSDDELFDEHLEWDRRHGKKLLVSGQRNNAPVAERPLRVGYVSADFKRHPIGYFLGPVLPLHDRQQFKVYCYYNRFQEDDVTLALKENADEWRVIASMSDDAVADLVRADAIDILVDLSGHTGENRLAMFARKPAPVQMTWAGYVGTTGLSAMDYLISDWRESPDGAERYCSEKIIRLPDCYVCYAPPEHAPSVGPLPAQQNGFPTFGCFNNLAKVTPQVIMLWARLLKALPHARMMLKTKALEGAETWSWYQAFFEENGISSDRIDLLGGSPAKEMLNWYNRVDIALDPFPYSGGLTTMEALWMGVPVVTLGGTRFCSRHSVSHLTTVGLPELIASSEDEYISIAATLAQDPERLATIRSGLRQRMAASPLCDGQRFTANLESAYREAWRKWCLEQTG